MRASAPIIATRRSSLALIDLVIQRLDEQGQFETELWGPFLTPDYDEFALVWNLLQGPART